MHYINEYEKFMPEDFKQLDDDKHKEEKSTNNDTVYLNATEIEGIYCSGMMQEKYVPQVQTEKFSISLWKITEH